MSAFWTNKVPVVMIAADRETVHLNSETLTLVYNRWSLVAETSATESLPVGRVVTESPIVSSFTAGSFLAESLIAES